MNDQRPAPFTTAPAYRVVGAIIGVVLLASGFYILFALPLDVLRLLGVALLLALGGNLALASWRGRPSWLSKIGPLP